MNGQEDSMIRKIQCSVGDLYRFEIIEVYGEEE